MSSLKKYEIEETSILHLRDAEEELMYADGDDGTPDKTKPMRVHLYGPGSKQHAKAKASAASRTMDRFKKKGKTDLSHEDQTQETSKFLTACTKSMENIDHEGLSGDAMFNAIYSDLKLIFIPMQIDKYLADTANFTKAAQKS